MAENEDWRTVHQVIPATLYERWKTQIKRVALANGISVDSWDSDSKFEQAIGPRVMTMECLVILMERTEDGKVFRV